ncbi:MAG: DUF1003 domain-containing protein [Frankiaceae bacterium]
MARESRGPRIDQPLEPRGLFARPHYDPETFGRLSERFARFLGTARFIVYMTVFIIVWILWNTWGPAGARFDPRIKNYTLLTLILSLQASYAAPLILLAQNRQADRDRVTLEEDRARNERTIADTEYLTREVAAIRIALGEVATRDFLRSELQRLMDDLGEEDERRTGDRAGEGGAQPAEIERPA